MPKRTKKDKRPVAKIDFKPYGAAIKAGRTKQKESRNKAADALFISPRYLANIENKGQHQWLKPQSKEYNRRTVRPVLTGTHSSFLMDFTIRVSCLLYRHFHLR